MLNLCRLRILRVCHGLVIKARVHLNSDRKYPSYVATRHVSVDNNGVRELAYQHSSLELSRISGRTNSTTTRLDGMHSRLRHPQGCVLLYVVCNTTIGSDYVHLRTGPSPKTLYRGTTY